MLSAISDLFCSKSTTLYRREKEERVHFFVIMQFENEIEMSRIKSKCNVKNKVKL